MEVISTQTVFTSFLASPVRQIIKIVIIPTYRSQFLWLNCFGLDADKHFTLPKLHKKIGP
jgi:hypothetical protein